VAKIKKTGEGAFGKGFGKVKRVFLATNAQMNAVIRAFVAPFS
jgi:hypothetical protein